MGIGYYHFERNKFYNKVDNPSASGDSVFPFIGSRFIYSPIPMGPEVPVYRSFLSEINASGYIPRSQITATSALQNSNVNNIGPINSIYEIEINGVQNSGNNCPDCTLLNGKYYVMYRNISNNSTNNYTYISLTPTRQPENNNYWLGHLCNDTTQNRSARCVNYKYIALAFYKNDGPSWGNVWSSGQYGAQVTIYGGDNTSPYGLGPTYINIFGSGNNPGRKYLLEESFGLRPAPSGLMNYNASTGVYSCDYSQSTCTVRPYRNGLFDLPNTSNTKSNHKLWPFMFGYHSYDGDVVIPDSGHMQKVPSYFDVTFSGVPNIVAYSSCIPCNEYFSQNFRLRGPANTLGLSTYTPESYFWAEYRPYYGDYMNIGDYGCDTANYKGSDPAVCFKGINLTINSNGFAELLIDAAYNVDTGSSSTYTSTIKLSKYLGLYSGINLCNSSLFDSTGWDYSLSGTVTPTTFPISSLCNFSGIVPIITPVCQSGICECVNTGDCLPLCSDLKHPKTIVASFTVPSEGVARNVAYTISNDNPLIYLGPQNASLAIQANYIRIDCPTMTYLRPNGTAFYQLPAYVAYSSQPVCPGSGLYVSFYAMEINNQVYQGRKSIDCVTNSTINASGAIGYVYQPPPFFLDSTCHTETFPVTFTLQDFV